VDDAIAFAVRDIADLPVRDNPRGVVACNPPMTRSLPQIRRWHRALGEALKRATPAWCASLLCGDFELARATGLRAKRYQLFNGPDRVQPHRLRSDRAAGARGEASANWAKERADGRQPPAQEPEGAAPVARACEGVDCFRAYDADIPEYACAVDVYTTTGDDTWLHVQEYAAPADIPEATTRKRLNELLAAVREVFEVPKERVAVKTRSTGKGGSKAGNLDHRGEFARLESAASCRSTCSTTSTPACSSTIARCARGWRWSRVASTSSTCSATPAWPPCRRRCRGGHRPPASTCRRLTEWLAENLRERGGRHPPPIARADALKWLEADRASTTWSSATRRPSQFQARGRLRRAARPVRLPCRSGALANGGVLYFSNSFRRFKLDEAVLGGFATLEDISASHPAGLRAQPAHPSGVAPATSLQKKSEGPLMRPSCVFQARIQSLPSHLRPAAQQAADDRRRPLTAQLRQRVPPTSAHAGRSVPVHRVLVTGMLIRWIRVRARPIAMGAKPAGAFLCVAPRITMRNIAVSTTSHRNAAAML
jgi:23S rRNA (guanine2445-N2)-methyltransferase / 23S rRNA (guanine2069-N7)-methyltransferase